MDPPKDSPFVPTSDVPLHKNAPLAPSQELAYRKKCIALKRRLNEVEVNNDATRQRISQEKERINKMRLNRSILLNHLKNVMETPPKQLTAEQREEVRSYRNGYYEELYGPDLHPEERPDGEGLLDDDSEESEEEPEPAERPERRRRANNTYRESIMTTGPAPPNPSMYQQPGLPNLAPAGASVFPPAAPAALTSSFRVASAAPQSGGPQPPYYSQQPYPDYTNSSPIVHGSAPQPMQADGPSGSPAGPPTSRPASTLPPQPPRPSIPFAQFTDHMRPQLEADQYPLDQIGNRIQQEWDNLSDENRGLWDKRYEEQMMEFTAAMDEWKKIQRKQQGGSFSEGRNRGV